MDLDLGAIRERLSAAKGDGYWRCLEEVADTDAFRQWAHSEFPQFASEWNDGVGRRRFLHLMGASLALAGLGGCARQPAEEILPYVRQPEDLIYGRPRFYATSMAWAGTACGLLVESHEGRPTKIEGNPDHPASLGATDAITQASILTLYDPDRAQTVTHIGEISSWPAMLGALQPVLSAQRAIKGQGLRILTDAVSSPTLGSQLRSLLEEMPAAKWYQYEPGRASSSRDGAVLAFGAPVRALYDFSRADVVLSLGSDFLGCGPGTLRYVRDFFSRRRLEERRTDMNRLYVAESTPTGTGAKADHRLPVRPSEMEGLAGAIAAAVGVNAAGLGSKQTAADKWAAAAAKDLLAHRGASLVVAGEQESPLVHALAHAMNHALGNQEKTVTYAEPGAPEPGDSLAALRELAGEMDSGQIDLLVIIGANPVYSAPGDLDFVRRLSKVKLRIHNSLYLDETSERCHWHVPQSHFLESWSDARAYDGTASIVQPLIAPLYRSKTAHEMIAALTAQPERSSHEIVREFWKKWWASDDRFEKLWRKALHDGVVAGTASALKPVALKSDWADRLAATGAPLAAPAGEYEIIFRPDPTIYDGQFANNGWLQELPKPLTNLTWDNAALVSPATAERLHFGHGLADRGGEHGQVLADQVELQYQGRKLTAPVFIVPGHADGCVTVHLGYGRTRAGRVGTGRGFNAYALRSWQAPWGGPGLTLAKAPGEFRLACTQYHHTLDGRDLLRSATLDEYRGNATFAKRHFQNALDTPSLYPEYEYKGYAWGMAIDLNSCVGCNACVVACQSENNIPVVGKEEVMHGREMHWLRIDRYYKGSLDNPEAWFQPVLCQHCENAPCEVVCPVQATTHSAEGLNTMVYNRCVGTRYCSNNCPYKVRRFNFLQFTDWETPSLKLLRNPEVTVRSRGVMEKCTYCVQRISRGKIEAEKENRTVRDGEIVTACQAACPAGAIVFGNINDPNSRVARLKLEPREYGLLAELNTRPRTTYLAGVRNPNPELTKG